MQRVNAAWTVLRNQVKSRAATMFESFNKKRQLLALLFGNKVKLIPNSNIDILFLASRRSAKLTTKSGGACCMSWLSKR